MDSKKFLGLFIPRASFYLWIILLLVAVIAALDWRIAVPGLVLLAFLTYYNISSNYKRKVEISSYIENLNFNMDTATKDTLLNFPMPLVVTEMDGSIVWYNSSFRKISEEEEVLEQAVKSFIHELEPDMLQDSPVGISRQMTLGGRYYNVLCNYARHEKKPVSGSFILVLYFIDTTELIETKRKYADEKVTAGLIVIDNYDELMQGMEDANRPQMLAEIDKKVVQWMAPTNGILKKYDRDKYLYLFESRYMKELEGKRFEILDTIKEINLGNKFPVTLSLGFVSELKGGIAVLLLILDL
jgi:c-di-AMP phosphodiesterase-like protein